jgi:hypothetical protein
MCVSHVFDEVFVRFAVCGFDEAQTLTDRVREKVEWQMFLYDLPVALRPMAERFPPWHLYKIVTTGESCRVHAYSEETEETENQTMKVWVTQRCGCPTESFTKEVFGVEEGHLELLEPQSL